ncbi:MAG: hypothetical protein NC830_06770 [Candidatus Omnitrophica bacterium]|nr:hypothetical protein [Candidatus Omnitrophota bacterium]
MKNNNLSKLVSEEEVKRLLILFRERFQQQNEFLIRVPARVNLLGTHVDHRGGWLNYVALDKNFWIVGSKRNDTKVSLINLDRSYKPEEFDIRQETPDGSFDWETAITKTKIYHCWVNYIKCAFTFLQHKFPEKRILGCNLACWGNVPQGAGLSSSSTLVTGSMIAACHVNNINFSKAELVESCGRAEWFVGTRGGWGDHAAMVFCKKNLICHMQFYPFRFEYFPFFDNTKIIVANSLIEAKKSAEAKGIFNQRVSCYEIGFQILKKKYPRVAEQCKYLRDINPEVLGGPESVYELLLCLPETAIRKNLYRMLPEFRERLDIIFQTHPEPSEYRIRDVVSYGIFECERSRICTKYLTKNDAIEFGRLMYISHDGDRIVSYVNGVENPWVWHADDSTLLVLKENAKKNLQSAHLHIQPGRYSCSRKELDFIVDCVKEIPGVYGAKLTGAGLGGCVVILSETNSVERILETLKAKYYDPERLPFEVIVSEPEDGAIIMENVYV